MKDYDGIRIYKFHFYGIDDPISIEAGNLELARKTLSEVWGRLAKHYQVSYVIGETIIVPLQGVTKKVESGVEYTWVGYELSKNGWKDTNSFLKEIDRFEKIEKIHKL